MTTTNELEIPPVTHYQPKNKRFLAFALKKSAPFQLQRVPKRVHHPAERAAATKGEPRWLKQYTARSTHSVGIQFLPRCLLFVVCLCFIPVVVLRVRRQQRPREVAVLFLDIGCHFVATPPFLAPSVAVFVCDLRGIVFVIQLLEAVHIFELSPTEPAVIQQHIALSPRIEIFGRAAFIRFESLPPVPVPEQQSLFPQHVALRHVLRIIPSFRRPAV